MGAGGRPEFPVRRVANAGDGLRGGVAAARARRPGARPDVLALYGMQRRHRFRQFLTHFSATRRPSRAMYCAPLRARAYWMLIGACNPKIGPIHVSHPLSLPHAHSRTHSPLLAHARSLNHPLSLTSPLTHSHPDTVPMLCPFMHVFTPSGPGTWPTRPSTSPGLKSTPSSPPRRPTLARSRQQCNRHHSGESGLCYRCRKGIASASGSLDLIT